MDTKIQSKKNLYPKWIQKLSFSGRFLTGEAAVDGEVHREEACRAAEQVGDRFCPEYAADAVCEDQRQDEREWNDDDDLAQDRKSDRVSDFRERHEGRLSRELQGHEHIAHEVDLQVFDADREDIRVIGEDADEEAREEPDQCPGGGSVDDAHEGVGLDRLADAVVAAGAVVEAEDRLRA